MASKLIEYEVNGKTHEAYMSYDEQQQSQGAILIAHAWAGRSQLECKVADMVSQWGYIGIAIDMYGKGVLGTSKEENTKLMSPFMEDRSKIQERLNAAYELANSQEIVQKNMIGAMGFCFGGLCVLDAARMSANFKGVASFHGLLNPMASSNGQLAKIESKVLVLHGYKDPMVDVESVNAFQSEMEEKQADWRMCSYGQTMHSFTNPNANDPDFGTVYHPQNSERSMQLSKQFFDEILR